MWSSASASTCGSGPMTFHRRWPRSPRPWRPRAIPQTGLPWKRPWQSLCARPSDTCTPRRSTPPDYRRLCLNLGQTLRIPDTGETVTALDIDRQYGLVVRRRDGTVDTLRCGEVSVRGLYGYV